jgi:hypothetical protein
MLRKVKILRTKKHLYKRHTTRINKKRAENSLLSLYTEN